VETTVLNYLMETKSGQVPAPYSNLHQPRGGGWGPFVKTNKLSPWVARCILVASVHMLDREGSGHAQVQSQRIQKSTKNPPSLASKRPLPIWVLMGFLTIDSWLTHGVTAWDYSQITLGFRKGLLHRLTHGSTHGLTGCFHTDCRNYPKQFR
jgi:hypothetical protein